MVGELVTEQPGAAAVALFGRYSPEAGSLEVLQPAGELVTVVAGVPEKTVKHLRTKMRVQKVINDLAQGLGLHYWTLSLEAGGETYVSWNTTFDDTLSARDLEGCWIGGLFIPVIIACFKIQPKSDDEFNVGGATCGVIPWFLCAQRHGPRKFCIPLACQRWDFNAEGDYMIGHAYGFCPVWHAKRVC